MALLHFDGFDSNTSVGGIFGTSRIYQGGASGTNAGRTGINSARVVTQVKTNALPATSPTCIQGFAFQQPSGFAAVDLISVYEGTTLHMRLSIDSTGHLLVKRGTTTIATSSVALALSTWYYIEFKVFIDDTTGTYEVKVDEAAHGGLSATGQDTRNGGATGQWDMVALESTNPHIIDDWYVCDGAGSINNDFLGDSKVETLFPQTDAVGGVGTHRDFTPSSGTDHGALIDEASANTTDYLSSSTPGHRETSNFPSLSLSGTVRGVAIKPFMQKTDAGARTATGLVRVGGSTYTIGTTITPTTAFIYEEFLSQINPNSGVGWLVSDINGAEFGLEVTT